MVVNVAARDLGLGSGGFDIVHVNLTRGLEGAGIEGAHVMKLNYTSLQHAVEPVEAAELELPVEKPVAVCFLHAQLPCVAWAARERGPDRLRADGRRRAARLALARRRASCSSAGCSPGTSARGPAFGGEHDAITTIGGAPRRAHRARAGTPRSRARARGSSARRRRSATAGWRRSTRAHAALALGCRTILVPRMSSGDARARHWGVSHHTRTVLDLRAEARRGRPLPATRTSAGYLAQRPARDDDGPLGRGGPDLLPGRARGRAGAGGGDRVGIPPWGSSGSRARSSTRARS